MNNSRKIIATAITAAVLGLGVFSVNASMAEPMGRGGHEFLPLRDIHDKLHLAADQEKSWQTLEQKTKDLRMSGQNRRNELKSQTKQELDKAEPDLARLAALADRSMDEQTARMRELRGEWLKFYAQLAPEQKLVVRDAIKARMAKAEMFREKFKQRREGKNPS